MIEIERKFLTDWNATQIFTYFNDLGGYSVTTQAIEQFYLTDTGGWINRARTIRTSPYMNKNENILTMKRPLGGISAVEIETPLSDDQYLELLRLEKCNTLVKSRLVISRVFEAAEWEKAEDQPIWFVDVFQNPSLLGLVLVEVELPREDYLVDLPEFIKEEVTHDPAYRNATLFAKLNVVPA